jgi:hypothetical protein
MAQTETCSACNGDGGYWDSEGTDQWYTCWECAESRAADSPPIKAVARIDQVLEHLNGNKEHFRKLLEDKDALLASVCDYAEYRAEKARVPPWSIIGEITSHGSGVSSAIYELYRRQPKPE